MTSQVQPIAIRELVGLFRSLGLLRRGVSQCRARLGRTGGCYTAFLIASDCSIRNVGLRIISVEGLIGFKLQGFVNDAARTRDLDDIRALLQIHRASLDMDELRQYFALFDKPELLNELLG